MSSIKEKIQKMLELAKRGGTEAEADTAMRMVLQALAKHNLEMSDVEVEEEEDLVQVTTEGGLQVWNHVIWIAISELYFCKLYATRYKSDGHKKKAFILVGRKENVDTAKAVITYLIDLGKELSIGGNTLYRNSFKNGYSMRIHDRCTEEKNKVTDLTSIEYSSMAPAIINLYALTKKENENFLEKTGVKVKTDKISSASYNEEGFRQGMAAGDKVNLRSSAEGRIGY